MALKLEPGRAAYWVGNGLRSAVRIVTGNLRLYDSGPRVHVQHSHEPLNPPRPREWAPVKDLEICKAPVRKRPKWRACVPVYVYMCSGGFPTPGQAMGTRCFWKCAEYGVLLRPPRLRNKAGTLLVTPRIQQRAGERWASVRRSPHRCRQWLQEYFTCTPNSVSGANNGGTSRCSGAQ